MFIEAKVFSCFVKLMDKMEHNFPHGEQMDQHLANINSLIQVGFIRIFTRAWMNSFTLTFRALDRNYIASTSSSTIGMLCFN